MPDRDIFRLYVRREWLRAAHLLFSIQLSERVVSEALNAAEESLSSEGCQGLLRIVRILEETASVPCSPLHHAEVIAALDQIACQEGSSNTRRACGVARRFIDCSNQGRGALGQSLAREFVIDFVRANLTPGGLIAELVESGKVSVQDVSARGRELEAMLRASSRVEALASRLLEDPNGAAIEVSRVKAPKLDPEAMLFIPLG